MTKLPAPDVTELDGREAYEVMVEHFDWPDLPTDPLPLDALPPFELEPTERDVWSAVLGDLKRGQRE